MNRNVEKQGTRNEEKTVDEMKVKEKSLESKENKTTWAHQERYKSRRASIQHYLRLTFCVSGCFRVRLIDKWAPLIASIAICLKNIAVLWQKLGHAAGGRTNVAENVITLGCCTFIGINWNWPVRRLNSHVSCSMTCLTGLFYCRHSDVVDQFVCDLEVSFSTSQSIKLSVKFDSSLPELLPSCQKTCWQLNHWYVHISTCHRQHIDIFYNMCPLTFTSVHLFDLTYKSGSGAGGQVELNEKAAEPSDHSSRLRSNIHKLDMTACY